MTYGSFALLDYVVFVGTIVLSLAIGLYYACFVDQKTNKDFLLGGRKMKVFPISISLLATYMSAVLVLGYASEMYSYGTLQSEVIVSFAVWVPLGGLMFLPIFYQLKLTSVYEYLELRFKSIWVRWLAAITFIVQIVLYLGIVLFAPSLALDSILDFPVWASILCVGGSATIYTALGGIRAVVWTDVFQVFMYLAGLLAIVIKGSSIVGGLDVAIDIANRHGRIRFLSFDPSPFSRVTSLSVFFGQGFLWVSAYVCHQTQVQRYCSMGSLRDAFKSLFLNVPLIAFTIGAATLSGIVIYANYATCDVVSAGVINKSDQIAPFFVVDHLSVIPGMVGLFVACLFSGSLSTVSSGLSSLAAVTWEDFLSKIYYFRKMSAEKQASITKILALMYGIVCICMAFVAQKLGGILAASLTVNGTVSGPLLGVFILGALLPFTNSKVNNFGVVTNMFIMKVSQGSFTCTLVFTMLDVNVDIFILLLQTGAITGMLAGHSLTLWISVGALVNDVKEKPLPVDVSNCSAYLSSRNFTSMLSPAFSNVTTTPSPASDDWMLQMYRISFLLYPLIGCLTTVIVGVIVSLFTGPMEVNKEMEPYVSAPILKLIRLVRPERAAEDMYNFDNHAFTSHEKNLSEENGDVTRL